MKDYPKISDAEWKVMEILWQKSPMSSTEIISALKDSTDWNPKTIHTLISRLVKKGAVGIKKGNNINEYFPLIEETPYKNLETESFLHKVYNGSIKLLVSNFIKDDKLSPEEIKELKNILEDKE
ncbi:BlaI/MecI/CopY family transcriptional regulator [Clostridium amazonitimonense]|uniref:BlaI/MecI/CopY family transcriptional regulator n=1 Tax=Clostridium amazonitimonense TaxID=1499689 RepID=UPI000509C9D0|nr:BlaI/MecI/CopY family transcriptional regulator [Clostridium amazonitimonense]